MRTGIVVEVTAAERDRLEAIVADRNSPQKHVWRAGIVLATADGLGTVAIMDRTAKSKTAVWRWQERFAQRASMACPADEEGPRRILRSVFVELFGARRIGFRFSQTSKSETTRTKIADAIGNSAPPRLSFSGLSKGNIHEKSTANIHHGSNIASGCRRRVGAKHEDR
jgi:hypothetical protein